MHCYLENRKAQMKTAPKKVHNTNNPITLALTSSTEPGSKYSIAVKFLNTPVMYMHNTHKS